MRASGLERSFGMEFDIVADGKAGALLPHFQKNEDKGACLRRRPLRFEVEGTIFLQERQIAQDVLLDFLRGGFGIDFLQICDDLLDGMLTVAALDDFEAWAVEAEGAFGHEQDTLLVVFAKAATGSEAWPAIQVGSHLSFFKSPLRAGMRRGAAS